MTKANFGLDDFSIAPRRRAQELVPIESDRDDKKRQRSAPRVSKGSDDTALMAKPSDDEKQARERERAMVQGEARRSLRNLKRTKQRHVKFYVNVALDQETKARLVRAAYENDVKMTVVMKEAIDFYLSENGY
ncbi:hypothetical protein [Ensifer sp. YR511]|uniref:hypothetical protein n=1 Tax=Ensifer sp. YR511 TaxID=1855294 RepID=UPI000882510C|nr:hypothetical protein [Ensifer sp. YR511]SDN95350.1 hypothetical protein SAMN05216328_14414 [Ensifer sp. YR511]